MGSGSFPESLILRLSGAMLAASKGEHGVPYEHDHDRNRVPRSD